MANPDPKSGNSRVYFAAELDKDIVPRLERKVKDYYDFVAGNGHAEKVMKSLAYNAGGTIDSGHVTWRLNRGGEDGEILYNFENHYRSIGQSQVNLTCAQRPAIDVIAKNSDKQAIARAAVAKGLIDFYLTEAGLEALLKAGVERGVFATEGFIFTDWDTKAGEVKGRLVPAKDPQSGEPVTDPMSGEPQLETVQMPIGDLRFRLYDMMDVVRDPLTPSYVQRTWVILRNWENKFDLAAKYPEIGEKIISLSAGVETELRTLFDSNRDGSDLIPVWEFYHEKTPACPNGRYVKFCKGIWLEGGPLPYNKIPIARCAPSELIGTPFGYSSMLDLLGAQETVNGLDTSMTTNQLGRGIGNMLVPRTANVTVEQFGSSMNAIKYDPDGQNSEIKALTMPPTPPEFFQYKKDKITAMETISGIGSVARGTPSPEVGADASGSKLALLDAKAIQQNDGLEKTHVQMIRDVALNIVRIFRDFGGSEKRLLKIVGKYNSYMVREFLPSDLDEVENVSVDLGNPVTRQISGRMALADRLAELGLIKPENLSYYITLIKEGTLDPMIQGQQAAQLRVEEENENLLEAKPGWQHRALITDEHWVEIPKHLELLDNPDLRKPGAEPVQQAVLAAVQEHMQLFRAMPPELVMLRGGANAFAIWQQMQMVPAGEQPQQQPGTPPASAKGGNKVKPSMQDSTAPESMAAAPTQPAMPKNPQTGQRTPGPRGVVDGA
ncbi:MAG: hypothetical protein IPJ65_38295 [Archangiaceae bacterium]|nr:hypothetical protein [Archangiaceae bacterium]